MGAHILPRGDHPTCSLLAVLFSENFSQRGTDVCQGAEARKAGWHQPTKVKVVNRGSDMLLSFRLYLCPLPVDAWSEKIVDTERHHRTTLLNRVSERRRVEMREMKKLRCAECMQIPIMSAVEYVRNKDEPLIYCTKHWQAQRQNCPKTTPCALYTFTDEELMEVRNTYTIKMNRALIVTTW